MATFVLIHGAGDVGWSWHLVADRLRSHGHRVLAPDLPCEDETKGLTETAETVIAEIGRLGTWWWWATPSVVSSRR